MARIETIGMPCQHERLRFTVGDYYVNCTVCGQFWGRLARHGSSDCLERDDKDGFDYHDNRMRVALEKQEKQNMAEEDFGKGVVSLPPKKK